MYLKSGSYDLGVFQRMPLSLTEQTFIFLAFFAAFAVKVPMWPVHTWLPDAHVEAPTGGSVVLAAIMLKMGGYGFLRLSLPIVPDASRELDWLMIALSLIAVVYIGFVALAQQDMKKLIAYSSIAHMGFVTLGSFIGYRILAHSGATAGIQMGLDGAMVQMISHGLVSGAMFLCVGVMYDLSLIHIFELMLLAVNFNFVAFSRFLGDINGQIFVFFILTVAAAEAAIGLAILVVLFRERRSIDVEELDSLQG